MPYRHDQDGEESLGPDPGPQVEGSFRATEERLRLALEAGGQLAWEVDLDSDIGWTLTPQDGWLGWPADQLPRSQAEWLAALHPEDRERVTASVDEFHRTPAPRLILEFRQRHKDGTYSWVLDRSFAVTRDETGRAIRTVGISTDITARKLAEIELAKEKQRLQLALAAGQELAWEYEVPSGAGWATVPEAGWLGWSKDELPWDHDRWRSVVHPEDRPGVEAQIRSVIAGEGHDNRALEYRVKRRDGSWAWVLDHLSAAKRSASGEAMRLVGITADISARKAVEAQLRESEKRARVQLTELEAIYDQAPVGLALFDRELGLVRVNGRLAALHDGTAQVHPAQTLGGATPELRKRIEPILRHVLATGEPVTGVEFRAPELGSSGEPRWCLAQFYPLRDESGEISSIGAIVEDITERRRADEERRRALADLQDSFSFVDRFLPGVLFRLERGADSTPRYTRMSASSEVYFGVQPDQVVADATVLLARVHPDDRQQLQAEMRRMMEQEGSARPVFRTLGGDGTWRWLQASVMPRRLESGQQVWDGIAIDVTSMKDAEAALRESEARFRRLIEEAPVAILIFRQMRCIYANPSALSLLAASDAHDVVGRPMLDLVEGQSRAALKQTAMEPTHAGARSRPQELRCRRLDGRVIIVESTAAAIVEDGQPAIQLVLVDITARKRAEASMRHMAHHDVLTGLPNRLLLIDRLDQAIAQAARDRQQLALMVLDLDGFKEVNDTLGHAAGDELLCLVAQRVRNTVRASDTLARLGGDEFAVVQTGVTDSRGAAVLATNIIETVSQPFVIDGQEIRAGVSIGISVYPNDGTTAGALLQHGDLALYRAKDDGRNRLCFFEPDMNAAAQARRQMGLELRVALERGELCLEFQPQIEITTHEVIGVEALLRWNHPTRGVLGPTEFVPIAESTGLIRAVGNWVLDTACEQARDWQRIGRLWPISINVSAVQLRDETFGDRIMQVLARLELPPELLCIELTESLLIDPQLDGVGQLLERLAARGVRIAIDDFGTGYSSLMNLKRLPVHQIKIDRSFVRAIGRDPESEAIIRATVGLAHSLGKTVVAEGVETIEQAAFLSAAGCNIAQGFLYGRPIAAADVGSAQLVSCAPVVPEPAATSA